MPKVAIVDKYPCRVQYKDYFDFDFDLFHLTNSNLKKVLKKDVTLDQDLTEYDFIILIGAEPAKHIGKISGIVKYQGYLLEDKYLPLTNPVMLKMKPEGQPAFDNAVNNINNYVSGKVINPGVLDVRGIQNTKEINEYLGFVLNSDITHIAMDMEASALYPRDGYLLGISITHEKNQGYYLDSDYLDDYSIILLQHIINTKVIIFHNSKFDMKWLSYHLGLIFNINIEDTLLLHYCLDETTGTHGLKELSIKYTKLGDYDRDLEIFKKEYCSQHKILQRDFSYEKIPFDIMCKYACIDTLVTFELYYLFKPKVKNSDKLSGVYRNLLIRGTRFLNTVEENGVPFNKPKLINTEKELTEEITSLEKSLYEYREIHELETIQGKVFNPGSVMQLRNLFFNLLGLEPTGIMTDNKEHSTNAEALGLLADQHPIASVIHKIRKITKIKNTYITKVLLGLDKDSRLRTGFNLFTTTSGRLSSSGKLNMQQLPRDDKRVKDSIEAAPGHKIVSQDR